MTIIEAKDVIESVAELPMFSSQAKQLQNIVKKIEGVISDLSNAYARQTKKKSTDSSLTNPEKYPIEKEFEEHLDSLSRLVNVQQWTAKAADLVGIELDRAEEYIEICVAQTSGFVEDLRKDVCVEIADITLDGETKQWISTVVGLIVDIILLCFYGLIIFKVTPFGNLQINDTYAGFIGAVASVATVAITLVVCAIINRAMIRRFDKKHVIKYSELVRASNRSTFKKSMMLMSFGEDLEELKKIDSEIFSNTSRLLMYSITTEKVLKGNSQKLDYLNCGVDRLNKDVNEANKRLNESLQNEQKLEGQVANLKQELKIAADKASEERQQFHAEATEQRRSHQEELEKSNELIKCQKEIIEELKQQASQIQGGVNQIQDGVEKLPQIIADNIPTTEKAQWICKVCCKANSSDATECTDCRSPKSIADNIIEDIRKQFEPELIFDGSYLSKKIFVCLPKNYTGKPLNFDERFIYSSKTVFIPKDIKSIDLATLLPNESQDNITIRIESNETDVVNGSGFTIVEN